MLDALIKYLYGHDYTQCEIFHPYDDTQHDHTFQEHVDIYFLGIEHEFPALQQLAAHSAKTRLDWLVGADICAEAPAIFDTIKTVLDRTDDDDRLFRVVLNFFQSSNVILNAKYPDFMAALQRSHSKFGMKVMGWGPAVTDRFSCFERILGYRATCGSEHVRKGCGSFASGLLEQCNLTKHSHSSSDGSIGLLMQRRRLRQEEGLNL